jgi:hypothetical protein
MNYNLVAVDHTDNHLASEGLGDSLDRPLRDSASCWRANLARAKEQDFFAVVRNGVVADVARVLDAEKVQARHDDGHSKDDVRFVLAYEVPNWMEGVIGTEVAFKRNPVRYLLVEHNEATDQVLVSLYPSAVSSD